MLGAEGLELPPGLGHPVSLTGAEEEEKEEPLLTGSQAWAQYLPLTAIFIAFLFWEHRTLAGRDVPCGLVFLCSVAVMKTVTKTLTLLSDQDSLR